MNRRLVALCALGLSGCYADYVTPDGSAGAYFSIPVGAPAPLQVGMAPPPPRYESPLSCGYGQVWIPGQWDWNGNWYWQSGFCSVAQAGYAYIPPQYSGGYYIRGHWGRPGAYGGTYQPQPGYVPPPAPAYGGGNTYVPPPQPSYNRGTYVPPPPASGGYVPPPQPNYAAPPPAPGRYVPPPAPAYNNRGNYVPPPPPAR